MNEHEDDGLSADDAGEALPASLDELLAARVSSQSELPWLAMRVDRRIEALEQARRWLHDNPALRVSKGPRALLEGLSAPRLLTMLGAGAVGALLGQQLSGVDGLLMPWVQNAALVYAVLGGIVAALATQVPYLRSLISE